MFDVVAHFIDKKKAYKLDIYAYFLVCELTHEFIIFFSRSKQKKSFDSLMRINPEELMWIPVK